MAESYVEENERSRQRLESLAARLTAEDLAQSTDYGWSVGALFAHLAWWDRRVLVLLRRWKARGFEDSPIDSEAVNDSLKPLCHGLEPSTAVRLCLAAAAETDDEAADASPELIEQIARSSTHFRLNRAIHRNAHLDHIEALLRSRPTVA
ncbi:MAG TPA: DinB family protein [Anaerolineales bacterium]|nr:DinB family protein [Anaerolineales bacterium]